MNYGGTAGQENVQSLAGGYLSEMEQLPPGIEINEPQPKISLRKGKQ